MLIIKKSRIKNLAKLNEYNFNTIEIGVPVLNDEAVKVGLKQVGDIIIPSADFGICCRRNAYGDKVKDKSQPKKMRYVATNWIYPYGNKNKSPKAVDINRQCYISKDIPSTDIEFTLYENNKKQKFVIAYLTQEIRDKYLLNAINLFLEIYGECRIFDQEIELSNQKRRYRCQWELLPPGEKPSIHLANSLNEKNKNSDTFDVERLRILDGYDSEKIVEGINGFNGYYAYIFNNCCVLESANFGNATYIIPKENWEILSQKTKKELTDSKILINKIIHTANWESTLRPILIDLGCQEQSV